MQKSADLQNRATLSAPAGMIPDKPSVPAHIVAEVMELRELKERIERARTTKDGEELHCADCFRRGRSAALRIIDGQ